MSCSGKFESLPTQRETSAYSNYIRHVLTRMWLPLMPKCSRKNTLPDTRVCGIFDILLWKAPIPADPGRRLQHMATT